MLIVQIQLLLLKMKNFCYSLSPLAFGYRHLPTFSSHVHFLPILILALLLSLVCYQGMAQKSRLGFQNFIIVPHIYADSAGDTVDLVPRITDHIIANTRDSILYPGGALYIVSDSVEAYVLDTNLNSLINTYVECGALIDSGEVVLGLLVSSDTVLIRETFGIADILEIGIRKFLPDNVQNGDTLEIIYSDLHIHPDSSTPCGEVGLSEIPLSQYRAGSSYCSYVGDSAGVPILFKETAVLSSSLGWLRWFGKRFRPAGSAVGRILSRNRTKKVIEGISIGTLVWDLLSQHESSQQGDNSIEPLPPAIVLPKVSPSTQFLVKWLNDRNQRREFTLLIRSGAVNKDTVIQFGFNPTPANEPWILDGKIKHMEIGGNLTYDNVELDISIWHALPEHDEGPNTEDFDLDYSFDGFVTPFFSDTEFPNTVVDHSTPLVKHKDWFRGNSLKIRRDFPNIESYVLTLGGVHMDKSVIEAEKSFKYFFSQCLTSSVTLEGPDYPGGTPSYLWTGPNNFNSTVQSPVLSNFDESMGGEYIVNVNFADGCPFSDTIVIEVVDSVQVVAVVTDSILYQGDSVLLSGAITATLQGDLVPIPGQWSAPGFLSFDDTIFVWPDTTTNYTYSAAGLSGGCGDSARVTIYVREQDTIGASSGNADWYMYEEASQPVSPPVRCHVIPPSSFWGPAISGTEWLSNSPNGTTSSPAGWYDYRTTFELASKDTSMRMLLDYMGDDTGSVYLNGHLLIGHVREYINPIHIEVTDTSMFNIGLNTVQTRIWNDVGPHGFNIKVLVLSDGPIINSPEALREDDILAGVILFPNPAEGTVSLIGLPGSEKFRFSISDLWGRTLLTGRSPEFNLETLPSGVYIYWIVSRERQYPIRFIKQ